MPDPDPARTTRSPAAGGPPPGAPAAPGAARGPGTLSRRTVAKAAAAGLTAAVTAAAVPAAAAARGTTVTRLSARTLDVTLRSSHLGRDAPVRLILPEAFEARPDATWPVLYLLHGAHDDYTSWSRELDLEGFTAGRDIIVAMPDGGPTGIPTKWLVGGDYESFQIKEVHEMLRSGYRASSARAVAGVSTGGYGAMAHAARNPGAFRAAASYSGILDTTLPGIPVIMTAILAREGLLLPALWGDLFLGRARWDAFNPRAQASALRGTPLYVSNGSGVAGGAGDLFPEALESAVWPTAQSFAAWLALQGIPLTRSFYLGGSHAWSYWDREFKASWPMFAKALGVPV